MLCVSEDSPGSLHEGSQSCRILPAWTLLHTARYIYAIRSQAFDGPGDIIRIKTACNNDADCGVRGQNGLCPGPVEGNAEAPGGCTQLGVEEEPVWVWTGPEFSKLPCERLSRGGIFPNGPVRGLNDGEGGAETALEVRCEGWITTAMELDRGEPGVYRGVGDTLEILWRPADEDSDLFHRNRQMRRNRGDLIHGDLTLTGSEDEPNRIRT